MTRNLGVLPVALAAAVLGTPSAHADTTNDFLNTLLQHHIRTLTYQDRSVAMGFGLEVCQHLRDGSPVLAESGSFQRRGATAEQAEWIVRSAQTYLCPDTIQPGG
jgi:hypothetical protein